MACIGQVCGGEQGVGGGEITVGSFWDPGVVGAYRAYLAQAGPGRPATLAQFAVGFCMRCAGESCGVPWCKSAGGRLAIASGAVPHACVSVAAAFEDGGRDAVFGAEGTDTEGAGAARGGGDGVLPGGVGSGGDGVEVGALEAVEADPLEGLVGRRRRKKKRAMKAEAKGRDTSGSEVAGAEHGLPEPSVVAAEQSDEVSSAVESPRVETAGSQVPEWRRKRPAAPVHKGYFSDCSDEVQRQLKESRARMLVAKNNEMAIRAEAAVKTRLVEQAAELKRLQTEAKLKKALESKFGVGMNSGFAETVVSNGLEEVCGTPSLSNGSVSPNSSISVCAVRKMEQTIKDLAEKVRDLQREKDALLEKKEKDNGKEKSDEDYDGPISEAEYRRNCDIMYGMRPGATKPMDAKYDELMVKVCAEGFSALGTEDLNELQAYGEFYG